MYNQFNEPNILKTLNNSDFVPEIISSFQDYDYYYLVTTFYDGTTLENLETEKFSEEKIKFLSACVILSLKYLRENYIIHRDVSFNNIIMDKYGYFNLIDFSFSTHYKNRNIPDTIPYTFLKITPPEILNKSNYDYNSDYFRLGSLIFFLIFKEYPDIKKNGTNIDEIIMDDTKSNDYSKDCIEFLKKLIIPDFKKRIGFKNINELMNHHWFHEFDWKNLEGKKIISPFKFVTNEINKVICTSFEKTNFFVEGYKYVLTTPEYKKLIQNFEFSNIYLFNKSY